MPELFTTTPGLASASAHWGQQRLEVHLLETISRYARNRRQMNEESGHQLRCHQRIITRSAPFVIPLTRNVATSSGSTYTISTEFLWPRRLPVRSKPRYFAAGCT